MDQGKYKMSLDYLGSESKERFKNDEDNSKDTKANLNGLPSVNNTYLSSGYYRIQ